MIRLSSYPAALFAVAVIGQWLTGYLGDALGRRRRNASAERRDFATSLGTTLTLLALIIGFTFSMAVGRYDQRKNDEEAEANAIGTEYVRADLLPEADAAALRELLKQYLAQRVLFYEVRDGDRLARVNAATGKLQAELWSAAARPGAAQPTPLTALVVSGMNDVLNTQGYTQAAWWNRIPRAAWALMGLIALFANLLLGYGEARTSRAMLLVLPVVVSSALALIADIDSPRGGAIRVQPQNLIALSQSLGEPSQ